MSKLMSDEELNELLAKFLHREDYISEEYYLNDVRRLRELIHAQKRAAVGAALEHQAMIQSPEYKAKKFITEQRARIR